MYKIYALVENKSGEIFYIGRTKQDVRQRFRAHKNRASLNEPTEKDNLIRLYKFDISCTVLDSFDNYLEAKHKEQYFIDLYKPRGNSRIANSISPKLKNNVIEFSQEMLNELGKIADYKFAEKYKISKTATAIKRKKLNIPDYASSTGNNGKFSIGGDYGRPIGYYRKFKPEDVKLLGTMTDKSLALLLGLHKDTIRRERVAQKIQPFTKRFINEF